MIHWKQRVQKLHRFDDIEKPMWRTHLYFVDFENGIHVEISTSKRCHNFQVDSSFKIDIISTNFPRGISMSNRWRFHEDVSIGLLILNLFIFEFLVQISRPRLNRLVVYDFLIAKQSYCFFIQTMVIRRNPSLEKRISHTDFSIQLNVHAQT